MPSSQPSPRAFGLLALALTLLTAPLALAGLENGEVFANNWESTGGTTAFASDPINMRVTAPDPTANPPYPPTFARAAAGVVGSMRSLDLSSSATIESAHFHTSSSSTALIDFVDNLIVNAEGIAPGTNLIVEVAWNVGGSTSTNGPDRIKSRSKILIEAPGVQLDPDPEAPDPPKQTWTRDLSNFVPDHFDDLGVVTFEYLVQAGTPRPRNIHLRSVAGVLCGGPGSVRSGNYDSGASAQLSVNFIGATNVKTVEGEPLYRWTTNAQSTLAYGSRNDSPPSNPELIVGPSAGGPSLVNLSWETVLGEYYLVERNAGPSGWSRVTEVRGTGSPVSVDLFKDAPPSTYRLISKFGSGTPNPSLVSPELRIFKAGDLVRVAWKTNHWENHVLNEIDSSGNSTLIHQPSGHGGGVVWFDFSPTAPARIFQVTATLK